MSELEIRKRQEYKRKRKKWTIIQLIALVVIAALSLGSFWVYDRMNRTYYIEYTEHSNIEYKVQYKDTSFFEEEWLEKDKAYISFLVQNITADFNYNLNMDTSNVGFDSTYRIDALLSVADKDSGNPYYTVEENLLAEKKVSTVRSPELAISEQVSVDFVKFNDIATSFIGAYGLKNASAYLTVTLKVDVLSSCSEFEQNNENSYSTSIVIPLAEETFSIESTSSVPESESKVLACSNSVNQNIFFVIGIITAILAVGLAVTLVIFLNITKNEDITYTAKIKKLLRAYGSYIQRIEGDFNDTEYQTVAVKTFMEMLGIRDTIQSPILMAENKDQTMTRFIIPTNTKICYVFEIKVENYDELYAENIEN